MNGTKSIPLPCLIAGIFWALAVLLLGIEVFLKASTDLDNGWPFIVGHGALLSGMVGATLTVRGSLINLRDREHQVYEAGREFGRREAAGDSSLRAI